MARGSTLALYLTLGWVALSVIVVVEGENDMMRVLDAISEVGDRLDKLEAKVGAIDTGSGEELPHEQVYHKLHRPSRIGEIESAHVANGVERLEDCYDCPGACPAGMKCGECNLELGKRDCHVCAAGSRSLHGVDDCTKCPEGKTAGSGSPTCDVCPYGKHANEDQSECIKNSTGTGSAEAESQAAEKDLPVPDATSTPPTPRLWIGSHNDTHGDEFPVQHGKWTGPSKFDGKWLNCKTFVSWLNASYDGVSVNETSHSGRTCTSCPANQAFIMNFHKSRAGQCNAYTTRQVQKCIKLNENNNQEAFTAKAKLCTKVRLIEAMFNVNAFAQDTPERLFFKSVSGMSHRAVAKCAFRKETVCDDTGTCAEKKQIKCLEVCKLTKWQGEAKGGAWYDSCDATKCKGEHSIWPCREVGMME